MNTRPFITPSVSSIPETGFCNYPIKITECTSFVTDTYTHEEINYVSDKEKEENPHLYVSRYAPALGGFNWVEITHSLELYTIKFDPMNTTWYYPTEKERDSDYNKILSLVSIDLASIRTFIKLQT